MGNQPQPNELLGHTQREQAQPWGRKHCPGYQPRNISSENLKQKCPGRAEGLQIQHISQDHLMAPRASRTLYPGHFQKFIKMSCQNETKHNSAKFQAAGHNDG
jgi:hypothetical protein